MNHWKLFNVVPEVILKAITLLEKYNLKTLDSLHIASAIIWKAELFVSADKRQIVAAKKAGSRVKLIE